MGYIKISKNSTFNFIKQAFMGSGNTIEFEKATYKIKETLYFNSNNIIKGNGATLQMAAPIHNILMSYTTPNTTKYNGVHDVKIFDLNIEQMYGKFGACKCNGITLWHCNNIELHNVKVIDTIYFHGIEVNGSNNILFNNCNFTGYVIDTKNNFREMSQIDFSLTSAIYVHKSGSKCYDGTSCKNIKYINCTFSKSNSRGMSPFCIGNHCQAIDTFHDGIIIDGCKFYGDKSNKTGCAIRLVGMNDVVIRNCYSENFARFVFITNYDKSYNKNGVKVSAKNTDGLCNNIIVCDNTIKPLDTYKANCVFSKSNTELKHGNIFVKNNKILK